MNENEKRPPARDGRNPNCDPNCSAPPDNQPAVIRLDWRRFERVEIDGREYLRELDCGSPCPSPVRCLAEYVPIETDDVRESAAHYGRRHRLNDRLWAGEHERQHAKYVCGPFPDIGRRS